MASLDETATAFVEMAHQIVWCTVASVDSKGRLRSRVLHPIWEFDGQRLTGWIATSPTLTKRAHLKASPYLSCNYWTTNHDTCVAECGAEWLLDDESRQSVWDRFANGPEPVGYDPSMIPAWDNARSATFAGLKLDPWRLRVMKGTVMTQGTGEALSWQR